MFVLPFGAYPEVRSPETGSAKKKAGGRSQSAQRSRLRAWRLPLLAALATLVLSVVGFLWVWPYIARKPAPSAGVVSPARLEFDRNKADGLRALADSNFGVALEKFTAAVQFRDGKPDLLDPAESQQLESTLLAK